MLKKLVDTDDKISVGGRAHSFWEGQPLKQSKKFDITDRTTDFKNPFDVMKAYKIRGFEFGNWVDNNTRVDNLAAAVDSFKHLARIIGSDNLGFDGRLGLAFGARGKSHALAHYEPNNEIINLTKLYGMGSLAHEYGHALDYFFGTHIDQNKNYRSLVGGHLTARTLEGNTGGEIRTLATKIIDNCIYVNGDYTASYKRLKDTMKENIYWFRRNEIFARLFEQYISYKLSVAGVKNTFLAKYKYENAVYLTKEDFKRVLPMLDKLMFEFKQFLNNKKTKVTPVALPKPMKMAATTKPKAKTPAVKKQALKKPKNEPQKVLSLGELQSAFIKFDKNKLDNYERTVYNDFVKKVGHTEALGIIINQVEGDLSQLSTELRKLAVVYLAALNAQNAKRNLAPVKIKAAGKKTQVKKPLAKIVAPKTKAKKKSTGRADKPKVVNKSVSVSLNTAIADVLKLKKYSKVTPMEAAILYNSVKNKNFEWVEDGLRGAMLKSLEKKNYIYESFTKTAGAFKITAIGIDLFKAIRARLETLKGMKYGYNLFS